MDAYIAQWIGTRAQQQDSCAVRHFPDGSLAVVCDGMGGHEDGAAASKLAADTFVEVFADEAELPLTDRLHEALEAANTAVGEHFARTKGYGGTTLVAAFASHGVLRWISVGDSGLYLLRGGRLLRLNADHSMRGLLREYTLPGGMTPKEIARSGHCLRSAVTGGEMTLIDAPKMPYPLLRGDLILLASDGADELLESPESVDRFDFFREGKSPAVAVVEYCHDLQQPHADNVTVISMTVE